MYLTSTEKSIIKGGEAHSAFFGGRVGRSYFLVLTDSVAVVFVSSKYLAYGDTRRDKINFPLTKYSADKKNRGWEEAIFMP